MLSTKRLVLQLILFNISLKVLIYENVYSKSIILSKIPYKLTNQSGIHDI